MKLMGLGRRLGQNQCRCVLGALLISGLILSISGVIPVSSGKERGFACRDRLLVDYARPLEEMRKDQWPASGVLSFGPSDLMVAPGRSLILEDEKVTYSLDLDRATAQSGRLVRPLSLDALVTLVVASVDRLGRVKHVVRQRTWNVERLLLPERRFGLSVEPGLYRALLTVGKGRGTTARYSQHLRVLPRRDRVMLAIRGGNTVSGGAVVARVENRGTTEVLLPEGPGLRVERLEDKGWKHLEIKEAPSVMFEDPEYVPAGNAARCSVFSVASDFSPGLYRFSTIVEFSGRRSRQLFQRFSIS